MKPKLIAAIVVVALLVGVGAVAVMRFFGPRTDAAIHLVPQDAPFYASVFLNPSISQKRNLEALLERFERVPAADDARDVIVGVLDEALADLNMTYEEDVDPWLGDQMAFFFASGDVRNPAAAGLVATEDEERSREFFDTLFLREGMQRTDEGSYEGHDYSVYDQDLIMGAVEGFVVIGTSAGFEATVVASQGESLEDSEDFQDAIAHLKDDPIALTYGDYERLMNEIAAFAALDPAMDPVDMADLRALGLSGTTAGTFHVTRDAAVFESVASSETGFASGSWVRATGMVERFPAGAWLALGLSELGGIVTEFMDAMEAVEPGILSGAEVDFRNETGLDLRADILSWVGDAGLFLEGRGLFNLGGAVIVESKDPAASTRMMEWVRSSIEAQGAPLRDIEIGDMEGFAVQIQGAPQALNALYGDRVIVAFGDASAEAAVTARETLGEDSEAYRHAVGSLGEGFEGVFYIDLDAVFTLAEVFGASDDPIYRDEVKPWTEPLTHVVLGSRVVGDVVHQKFVIGVE